MDPGLAGRMSGQAARKHRRWLFTRAGAAGGTVLGVAGLAVAAGFTIAGVLSPATRGAAAPHVQTAAYVLSHVNHALASGPKLTHIESSQQFPGQPRQTSSAWLYGKSAQTHVSVFGTPGRGIVTKTVNQVSGHTHELSVTWVNYQTRTWWTGARQLIAGPGPGGSCQSPALASAAVSAATLHQLVNCGVYVVAGRQVVDGAPTIKLVLVKTPHVTPKPSETIWVDASTYLPVRIQISVPGQLRMQANLRWLPATPANLAHLKLTIPTGFKRVHTS